MSFSNHAAIVGIGATEFSKNSGRSELQLACEAVTAALEDAGIEAAEVDGMALSTMDTNDEDEVLRSIGGRRLTFFSRVHHGGGGAGGVLVQAVLAVTSGLAKVVVCYRAMNERSGRRFGQPIVPTVPTPADLRWSHHAIHGLQTAGALVAMTVRRYMYDTKATAEDFAHIVVASRKHAATNPNAQFYGKPITIDDYLASRMISDPLRLLDCCQESDGAVAVVITSTARARTLRQPPALIRAAARALPEGMHPLSGFYRRDISHRDEARLIGEQLYAQSGLSPRDMQAAILYDHFAPTLFPVIEGLGFCGEGQARHFVKDGAVELGGVLPINTNGGQLGEAYIHGMNGLAEAVRQVRGTAVNQVAGLSNILVTAGSGTPTSGLILGMA